MQEKQAKAVTTIEEQSELLERVMAQTVTYRPFMSEDDVSLNPDTVLRYFARPTRSGKECPRDQAVRFMGLCKARKLNPWEGDAFIVGYDTNSGPEFNLVTAHQAFLKRAETHKEYDGMESGVTVRDVDGTITDIAGDFVNDGLTLVGGWARVHLKTKKIPTYRRLKLATFNKNFGRWSIDPAGMVVKCAEADALRSSFPTSLGGLYLTEEYHPATQAPPKTDFKMPEAEDEPTADPPAEEHKTEEQSPKEPIVENPDIPDDEDRIRAKAALAGKIAMIEAVRTLKELDTAAKVSSEIGKTHKALQKNHPDLAANIPAALAKQRLGILRRMIDDVYVEKKMPPERVNELAESVGIPNVDDMDAKKAEELLQLMRAD